MIPPAEPRPPKAAAHPLVDPFGRRLDYLRLAVTERCNLRCRYCMPREGILLAPRDQILRIEEMLELCAVLVDVGVRKIRLTGGEPLLRGGLTDLVFGLSQLRQSPRLGLTTNGVLLPRHLDSLLKAGVRHINLSLDSLRPETFAHITRRDDFTRVRAVLDHLLDASVELKINVVVLPGLNDHELEDFLSIAREHDTTVRFIEPMPFDGSHTGGLSPCDGDSILARLRETDRLEPLDQRAGVAELFTGPGFRGRVGIIRGHSRTFCGDCSRLRMDARGRLRTCLYGPPVADLGAALRGGATRNEISTLVSAAIADRAPDGLEAERRLHKTRNASMASIGG